MHQIAMRVSIKFNFQRIPLGNMSYKMVWKDSITFEWKSEVNLGPLRVNLIALLFIKSL